MISCLPVKMVSTKQDNFSNDMRALRFEKTGSLDLLRVQDIPKPVPGPGEILVQIKAAAINPSDIKNVLGKMHETTLPRTPGRDFAGIVVQGSGGLAGKSVFGSGGNLGFGRDGSHAEFMVVPENGVSPLPQGITFDQAAAIGLPYLTAWAALVNAAKLQPGENVLILGADGAVGSAAGNGIGRRPARPLCRQRPELGFSHLQLAAHGGGWFHLVETSLHADR